MEDITKKTFWSHFFRTHCIPSETLVGYFNLVSKSWMIQELHRCHFSHRLLTDSSLIKKQQ